MRQNRIRKEVDMIVSGEGKVEGLRVVPREGNELEYFDVELDGPIGSPYVGGRFRLEVKFPTRYPIDPPCINFCTPIFHPNIDKEGRICLDSLKMPPKGRWLPSLNVMQLLLQIQLLLAEPNPDDPLVADISQLLCNNPAQFAVKAREHTRKYAMPISTPEASSESTTAKIFVADSESKTIPSPVPYVDMKRQNCDDNIAFFNTTRDNPTSKRIKTSDVDTSL